jgi:hypothetical protein
MNCSSPEVRLLICERAVPMGKERCQPTPFMNIPLCQNTHLPYVNQGTEEIYTINPLINTKEYEIYA